MRSKVKSKALCFGLSAFILGATGCVRSTAYKKDQFHTDATTSYYNKTGQNPQTPTQRIEKMGQPKKRVLVLNFWNDSPVKPSDLGVFTADELRRGLFASQRVMISPELKSEFVTEDFLQGDRIKVAQLIREGRKLGVAVLVIGRITKVVFRQRGDEVGLFRQKQSMVAVDLEIKVFDVTAGREIMATGKSGEASSNNIVAVDASTLENAEFRAELTRLALRQATGPVVPEVIRSIEKMSWEGHIAKVTGPKVFVNAGRASGLVPGDILKVMTQGDEVYDPASGSYLGRAPGQLKGTVEVVDFIGTDGAVAEVHTGGNFQEGDAVQLY